MSRRVDSGVGFGRGGLKFVKLGAWSRRHARVGIYWKSVPCKVNGEWAGVEVEVAAGVECEVARGRGWKNESKQSAARPEYWDQCGFTPGSIVARVRIQMGVKHPNCGAINKFAG